MTKSPAMHHQSAKSANRSKTRISVMFVACSLLGFSGLTAQANPGNDRLVVRKQGVQSTGGSFSVTASCLSGEVRLGGGYKLSHPELNSDEALSVEGNYPSGSKNWTVSGSHDSPNGTSRYIRAEAYCMQAAGASVQTIASPVIQSQPDGAGRFFNASSQAVCPGATILTGGGFRTSATKPHSGIYNAWLSSFKPVQNASGEARGWRAAIDAIQWPEPPTRPTLQTFVVCAGSNFGPDQITSGSVVSGNIPSQTEFGYSVLGPRTLQCPAGEVALSGGYNFGDSNTGHADLFVPHQILESHTYSRPEIIQREVPADTNSPVTAGGNAPKSNQAASTAPASSTAPRGSKRPKSALKKPGFVAPQATATISGAIGGSRSEGSDSSSPFTLSGDVNQAEHRGGDLMAQDTNPYVDFGGWTVSGIFGSQTVSQTLTGYAACFKLPKVRFTVDILTPEDNFTIGPDFSAGGNGRLTAPMLMTAAATDTNGQPVTNLTYTWVVDGVTVGSGASLSKSIATQSCGVDHQTVKVIARDSDGRRASDEVRISVGVIC